MGENSSCGYIPQFQDLTQHYFIASTSGASYFYTAFCINSATWKNLQSLSTTLQINTDNLISLYSSVPQLRCIPQTNTNPCLWGVTNLSSNLTCCDWARETQSTPTTRSCFPNLPSFQNHSTKRQIREEINIFLAQFVDHDHCPVSPPSCKVLPQPLEEKVNVNNAQQGAGISIFLKTGIGHAPSFLPRPAHRTTGDAQKDPAEANTHHHPSN